MIAASAVLVICDLICAGNISVRLVLDMMLAIIAMNVSVFSLWPQESKAISLKVALGLEALLALYYVFCAVGLIDMLPSSAFWVILYLLACVYLVGFIIIMWLRLRNIKAVMKSGTVWSFVCLSVDAVYFVVPAAVLCLMAAFEVILPENIAIHETVAAVLLASQVVAMAVRIHLDSVFVFHQDHERVIVESMKISRVESAAVDPETNELYRDIYERVLVYFEMSKPYLNGNLNINDVVKVVYSNKVYISRAICHYTGRNFRQFINYYRVMYSIDSFRNKPDMKVAELSESSGFNTVVSYTMAFRLFMNETPSEWCRKERSKLIKKKK